METVDFAFREIEDLEVKARSIADKKQRLDLVVKAADLANKYSQEWVDPLGRKELSAKFRHLVLLGERHKKDEGDEKDTSRLQMDVLEDALNPLEDLEEPISSRKELPTKEKILILKGSKFGGNKFPPWSRSPGAKEFDGLSDKEIVREPLEKGITPTAKELSLSKEHLLHFQGWARAEKAIPPPSLNKENTASPSMTSEKPFDLIQDVGVDCSVVASICALMTKVDIGQKVTHISLN
jgi:hypothetical protein